MKARKNDNRILEYDDRAMLLGVELYQRSEVLLELLYHLMKSKKLHSFSAILIRSEMEDFGEFLRKHKRKTDLLYEIRAEEGIFALFCQETQVDGGYYFIRRLTGLMEPATVEELRAAIIGVERTSYPVKSLIFIMLDNFIKAESPEGERILFRTVK
jgi:hypothetical protein